MPNNGGKEKNDESLVVNGGGLLKKGPWTAAEDAILIEYVKKHGEGNWNTVQKNSGLSRCGKSCRLRWTNHLRPDLKKGSFSPDEERLVLQLHSKFGNKWARMAAELPGRTDNEIKNYWNTRVKRRQRAGLPPFPQHIQKQSTSFHLYQPYPSPSSIPTTQLNLSGQSKLNYDSPFSLFDPISISSTTPLPSHHNSTIFPLMSPEFKRFQGNHVPTHQPCTFSSSLSTQWQPVQTHRYNCGEYGLNLSPILQNHFKPDDGLVPLGSSSSMKLELPSSQLPQPVANAAAFGTTDDYKIAMPLTHDNYNPLDFLLQNPLVIAGSEDLQIEEKWKFDGSVGNNAPPYGSVFSESLSSIPLGCESQWDDLSYAHYSVGVKRKKEPDDEIDSMDDELRSLLNINPSTMSIPELGYSDSGEMSNGQSSGVTDDDIGLEMQQLVSSLMPIATTADHDWNLGSWNNMPGIC